MSEMVKLDDARRIHPVSLFLSPKHEAVRLVARRDTHAALEIVPHLLRSGFTYGEPILDYPPDDPPQEAVREADLYRVEMPFVRSGDMLLQTTRPPMHDRLDDLRRRIRQSWTDLEDRMFDVWEGYVAWISRGSVLLHERFHGALPPPHQDKRRITFRQSEGAPYLELDDCTGRRARRTNEETERRTAVFLLRKEEAWPGGPGLIGAFGMDATATAVWCYRLGRDFSHLLDQPGFTMAEMTNPGFPGRPTNMLFARDWSIETLIVHKEGPAG